MSCQRCQSDRIASVSAKCSDMCSIDVGDNRMNGYVPDDMGIGGDDYIDFNWCLECGQLQGKFPLAQAGIEKDISDAEVLEFFNNHFTAGEEIDRLSHNIQLDIRSYAEDYSPKFESFLREFFEYNYRRKPARKFPSAEIFLKMYRGKDADLLSQGLAY